MDKMPKWAAVMLSVAVAMGAAPVALSLQIPLTTDSVEVHLPSGQSCDIGIYDPRESLTKDRLDVAVTVKWSDRFEYRAQARFVEADWKNAKTGADREDYALRACRAVVKDAENFMTITGDYESEPGPPISYRVAPDYSHDDKRSVTDVLMSANRQCRIFVPTYAADDSFLWDVSIDFPDDGALGWTRLDTTMIVKDAAWKATKGYEAQRNLLQRICYGALSELKIRAGKVR